MTKNLLLGVCIIIAAYLLGESFVDAKKIDNIRNMTIEVKGYASQDIKSDFADWTGSYSVASTSLQDAYNQIKDMKSKVKDYIVSLGAKPEKLEFSSIITTKIYKEVKTEYGVTQSSQIDYYQLTQNISVESNDIELIEKISKLSTNLISEGINIDSYMPRYFYTKIDGLKMQMLAKASKDAKARATQLAKNSGSEVGKLVSASQGVFQITSKNSQEVSDYGIYDTSTKLKTISAVITAEFEVEK